MAGHDVRTTGRPTGRPEKREAILVGALRVFARDGYPRASVEAIAVEAQVSTRTLYNHFPGKAQLFRTVIHQSAARVADAQIGIIVRHLTDVSDVERRLVEFGVAMATPVPSHAEHFALVRQIVADAGHIPQDAIDAWQEAGPRRVRRELARHLQHLSDEGLLRVEDGERAAMHLMRLISVADPSLPSVVASDDEARAMVTSGIRAFLHGHLPGRATG